MDELNFRRGVIDEMASRSSFSVISHNRYFFMKTAENLVPLKYEGLSKSVRTGRPE
jgi:hypothetical protein